MADDIILADTPETPTGGFLGIGATKPELGIILADEPVQEPTVGGEFKKGVVAGVHQLRGFGYGLGALAGEVTGSEPLKKWGVEGAKEVEETVKQSYAPNVGSYKDINNLNDALHYATYGVATNIPNILMSLASGGAGALIGKKLAATAVKDLTGEAAKSTIKKYMQRGAMTGAGLSSIGMETGTISQDQATKTGAINPVSAVIGGIAAGALDFIPEWYLMKRMGWFGDEVKGALGKRVASGFMKQVVMEAPTEAAQSMIERAAVPGKSISNREAWDEYIDSFILGGLTGGVAGAVGGVAARKSTEDQTPAQAVLKDDQLGQEIERQLIENDPDGITKPPIIPPSQLTPVEPVLPVAVETPTAPIVPETPVIPETVAPVVPEVTPAPVVEPVKTPATIASVIPPTVPAAETKKEETPSVFTRMPDSVLKQQAEYGVQGAKDELAKRTITPVAEPAPMVIPEETKPIVEETKPPVPETSTIPGSELLPPDEVSKLQSEADAANVKLIGIQDAGVGEKPMPMFNLTEEGKESTFTVEPGETVAHAADRVRAKFEVKTPEATSEPVPTILGEGAGGGQGVTEKVTPIEKSEPTPVFDESKSTEKVKVIDKDHMLEKGLTGGPKPTEQKKYLLTAIDDAIKVSSPEKLERFGDKPSKWTTEPAAINEWLEKRKTQLEVDKKKFGMVKIDVPGDGTYEILNTQQSLEAFKKMASKYPLSVTTRVKTTTTPIPQSTGKRIGLEGVEYYNEFKPRKQELIESTEKINNERRNFYVDGWFSEGHYAIKTEKPSFKMLKDQPDIKRIITENDKNLSPAKILGELSTGQGETPVPFVHAVSESGKDLVLNARLVDAVLTKYPKAEVFLGNNDRALVFKEKGKPVAIVMGVEKSENAIENFTDRIKELKGEGTKFSRVAKPEISTSMKLLQSTVAPLSTQFRNAANIEVVKSESDLPAAIQTDMARREGNPVAGVFHEGTIYLVSDNISSKREGLVTVAHELFHDGYHKLFQSLKTNKTFAPYATQSNLLLDQIWNRHQAEISNTIIKQYGLDPNSSPDRRTAAEEWLAKQTPDSQPKWYDRLAAIIANFLRKAMPSLNITNAEVRTLIEDVRQTLINKAEPVLNAEGPVAKYSLIDKKTTDYLKDLTSKFHSNPQSVITDKFIKENVRPFLKTQNDLQFADKYFGLPWWNAKKYPAWRRAFEIFGIQRPERRGELMHGYAQLAEPFFKMEETMRAAGKSSKEIADAKDRINRVIITGDAQLGPQLKSLRTQLRETKDEAIKQQLQKRIEQIEQDNRYSDEQLLDGIKDDRGNIVKLSQEEINTYASVRTALDSMFDSYIDHLQTMSFRTWSNQKWYAVLCQAAGMDLNKSQTAAIVGAGLDKAALLRARKIQPDIRRVFERVEQQIAQTPDADKIAAGEWYGKISDKMVAEITTLRQSLSDLTGETDQDKLTKMTREIFSAYMMTRPQLKRIKTLRNLYKKQVAFFPRVREQGDYKLTVTELINNKEGLPVQEKKLFMGMFNTEKEGAQVYADAMARYGKNGVFPANVHYSIEKSTKTPEFAFQGVNDINMQKVLDSAIESMKVRDTFVNDKGEKVNVQDYLRELGYQAIAKQFQSRGFGRHMTHRETGAIKGYKESDLQRVLFNYMTGMAGIMTKQESAADFLEHMKDVSQENNPKMFESLVKYGRDQLRNETAADKFSNKVRSFMFTWYLGGLLRPAIIQLTQNFVTGIPEHGKYLRSIGQGGAGKAESQYITAMKDVATKNMTSIEQRMQAQLFTEGVTVDQYIREIFGSLGTNLEQRFDRLLRWLAIPFSKMEMYNRQSAALTRFRPAYKLAISEGLSEEDAYKKAFESARNYVYDTHYAMGKANLPQIAQGEGMGIAVKTAYTFKSFTHNYVLEMAHSMSKGDFKTVMHSLAYIALFGGLMGLPFFKDLFEFAEKHFGWSFTKSIRQTLRGVGGKTLETFGMNGLPALLGANISGSIALGIPFMGEDSLATIGGVYEGQLVKFGRAAEAVGRGDWYRVSTNLAPEFMRNPLVAAEESTLGRDIFGTPGVSTTTRGRPVYDESGKPLSMTTGQAITKTLGFNPTEIGRQKEKDQTIRRQETYVQELKTDAGERYRIARINGDPKALSKMMAEVKDINKKIKDRGLESLVPRATVQKIIEASRESQTKKQRREMAYKKTEL